MRPLATALLATLALPSLADAQVSAEVQTVRVEARVVLLDRQRSVRAGLQWVQVGGGRIVLGDRGASGIRITKDAAELSAHAFVEAAAQQGVVTADTRMLVSVQSGAEARIASGALGIGRRGTVRETGPELTVIPSVLPGGDVQLEVRVRERDVATGRYGTHADASPVDVATTVVVRPGEPATIANVRVATTSRDAGLLRWESASRNVDALVVLTATVPR